MLSVAFSYCNAECRYSECPGPIYTAQNPNCSLVLMLVAQDESNGPKIPFYHQVILAHKKDCQAKLWAVNSKPC